eukprot:364887-Chlamydomonas_euryale.AAC.4
MPPNGHVAAGATPRAGQVDSQVARVQKHTIASDRTKLLRQHSLIATPPPLTTAATSAPRHAKVQHGMRVGRHAVLEKQGGMHGCSMACAWAGTQCWTSRVAHMAAAWHAHGQARSAGEAGWHAWLQHGMRMGRHAVLDKQGGTHGCSMACAWAGTQCWRSRVACMAAAWHARGQACSAGEVGLHT